VALEDAIIGCLLGTALGDAVGLSCEGLSAERQRRLYPKLSGPRLLFGRGMVSDDTEHASMVAQALIVSAGDTARFTRSLAGQLRLWLLGLPAGVGFATLRATGKLWLGFPAERSGVFSAGNGPAMRSPLLGVCYGQDTERLRRLVRASTRITHTDPKAEFGALAVALAAHTAYSQPHADPESYCHTLAETLRGSDAAELLDLIARAAASAQAGETAQEFAADLGLAHGVSGYIYHTVPVVLHVWFRNPADFRDAIGEIVRCGGDTDTTAAILGSILGAATGREGLPTEWLHALWEWPRTVAWMEQLGKRLAEVTAQQRPQRALPLFLPAVYSRNLVFLSAVLAHGFRRLLPPY
jgi:ADP-ribosylglycohydrolase